MRSVTKMSSEPNLHGNKSVGSKAFSSIKRSSAHKGPSMSYKLSSKVKRLLSKDLNKTCPPSPSYASSAASSELTSRSTPSLYTGGANHIFVCGDDASIQSTNTRRRFQRRGSKSASMFKSFSIDAFLFECNGDSLPGAITQNECIPKVSERSCLSGLGESTNTLSLEDISEEFGCSSEEFGC